MFFDTHAHYDDKAFDEDRDSLLAALPEAGVTLVIDPGCDVKSSRAAIELAARYEHVYAAVGIHPEELGDFTEENLNEIAHLARDGKCVAIGEIGLDYYWEKDEDRRALQRRIFIRQLDLARELHMPVCIHDRDAHGDTLAILKKEGKGIRGVLHCYSGSYEMARELIKMGWYIGVDGPLTFKNAAKLPEIVKAMPMERLLVETDAPYMAPVPMRGKRNEPAYVRFVAEKVAELRGMTLDEVAEKTTENAVQLYGL